MNTLKELYPVVCSQFFESSFLVYDRAEGCLFYVPDASTNIPEVFTTSLKAAAECASITQACTHFCSVLACMFSSRHVVDCILKNHGVQVKVISLPSMARTSKVKMRPGLKWPEMLLIFGQCFLILFKNFSTLNYNIFIKKAIEDMSIICGIVNSTPPIVFKPELATGIYKMLGHIVNSTPPIVFKPERATGIYKMLGHDPELKRLLMDVVLEKSESCTMQGKFMGYLSGMVAWNEMTALVYINDTLLRTESSVLCNPKVSMEVEAIDEAFKIVNQSKWPQFFAIYAKPNEMKLLEVTKFPTLAAVANKLMEDTNTSNFQSISTGNVNQNLVNELVAIHKGWRK